MTPKTLDEWVQLACTQVLAGPELQELCRLTTGAKAPRLAAGFSSGHWERAARLVG